MTCSAPGRLRPHRGAALQRQRAAGRRRRQPQQPALGRRRPGDPHRQPHGGGEEGQPRLPRLPRRRLQRHAHLRALLLRGHPRAGRGGAAAPARRAAARPPLAQLRVHARRPLRVRARLHRAQHHQRHDDGRAGGLRVLRRLRRGRAPLGPRAQRHHGGAAQARPAVRAHRARPPVRRAPLRDRRALRPRPDAGRRPSCSATATAWTNWWSAICTAPASSTSAPATRTTRPCPRRCARRPAASRRTRTSTTSATARSIVMGSGNLGLIYLMDESRRMTMEEIDERHPDLLPALRAHPHVGWLLVRSAEHGAVALGAARRQLPERGPRGGRGPAGAVLAHGRGPPAAHRRLRPRRRHHGEQLLRRAARRGLRVRGAHLVPRRHGRPADAAVPAAPGGARGAGRGASSAPRRRTACWPAGAASCRASGASGCAGQTSRPTPAHDAPAAAPEAGPAGS